MEGNKVLRTFKEFCDLIWKEFSKKDRYPSSAFSMDFRLRWLGGNKVQVEAWLEKIGAWWDEVEFECRLSKKLMAQLANKFIVDDRYREFLSFVGRYL